MKVKKSLIGYLSGLFILITFPGCDDIVDAGLNEEFFISPGQKAVIENTGLEIAFIRVLEDSRCPRGVECVWEGNGRVEISLNYRGSGNEFRELNTALDPKLTQIRNFRISLAQLQPYPEYGNEILPENYRISLIVTEE